jgi:hypothetical protein
MLRSLDESWLARSWMGVAKVESWIMLLLLASRRTANPLIDANSSIHRRHRQAQDECASFWQTCPFPSLPWRNRDAKDVSCVISMGMMRKVSKTRNAVSFECEPTSSLNATASDVRLFFNGFCVAIDAAEVVQDIARARSCHSQSCGGWAC